MDRQKENMVLKGMSNVHSVSVNSRARQRTPSLISAQGLGILLGVGHISSSTHEQILALLSDDEKESKASAETKNDVPRPKNLGQTSWLSDNPLPRQAGPDPAVSLIDLQQGMR